MTDRELLDAAARAAGIELRFDSCGPMQVRRDDFGELFEDWDPLADDGDALRLAVSLEMDVRIVNGRWTVATWGGKPEAKVHHEGDPYAATRRAIVRAAAALGEQA